jgi:hypothetical protein
MDAAVFIPASNDLESFFLSKEHIAGSCGVEPALAEEILAAAFTARKDEMLKKYVNTRVDTIRKAGGQANAGEISVEGTNRLTGPTSAAVHGKILMKGVRDVLRERQIADRLFTTSDTLANDSLKGLWD